MYTRHDPNLNSAYTPEEDVTETLPDGRTIQIASKGQPMPLSDAVAAGLVKVEQNVVPQERKVASPSAKKTPRGSGSGSGTSGGSGSGGSGTSTGTGSGTGTTTGSGGSGTGTAGNS